MKINNEELMEYEFHDYSEVVCLPAVPLHENVGIVFLLMDVYYINLY